MYSLCIAGKNQIAVDVLDFAASRFPIHVVPVATDTGLDGWQPSLRKAAQDRSVDVVDLEWAMEQQNLCFLSLEFDRLVRPSGFATNRLFNLHFSLLPKYRGCNTAIWPILNGDIEHGVALHWIDSGMDTGPIIDQRAFGLRDLTAREAYFSCMEVGRNLVVYWLDRLVSGEVPAVVQEESIASTYYRADLDFARKELIPHHTVEQVLRTVRAFSFPEYQLPTYKGREIVSATAEGNARTGAPGDSKAIGKDGIVLSVADGTIRLIFKAE